MRMVVVGAGIAGLAGAYEASRRGVEVTILEAEPRAGGKLWTERIDGVPLEWGADSFLAAKPAARELAEELGLRTIAVSPQARNAYVFADGALRPFPGGMAMGIPRSPRALIEAVRSGLVVATAALRAALEPALPGRPRPDATVAETLRKRVGRRWAERITVPLVEGVYGAPADDLGMRAALPQFAEARSLVLAARRQPSPTEPLFLSIEGGMAQLVQRLLEELSEADLRLRTPALGIERRGSGFLVRTTSDEIETDAVLVAVPAPAAVAILEPVAREAARALSGFEFSSSAVLLLRYAPGSLRQPMDGSGYLVPRTEGLVHAACSWVSSKWPHPGTALWLRAIVTSPDALERDDDTLAAVVADEVGSVMAASSAPEDVRIQRWEPALPIYGRFHWARVEVSERPLPTGIALAGASYRGIGVPDCIASGRSAAGALTWLGT